MPLVRTSDGKDVEWPWPLACSATTISLTAKRLEALRSKSAIARILAHKDLFDFQIARLYDDSGRRKRAVKMRTIAHRIVDGGFADLCIGIGEHRICNIFYATKDPSVLRSILMNVPYDEARAREDIQAIEALKEAACLSTKT